jgi:hypothetical protein
VVRRCPAENEWERETHERCGHHEDAERDERAHPFAAGERRHVFAETAEGEWQIVPKR